MNDAAYVLGIDIGTTGARVGIFDLKGNPIVFCSENFPLYTPASGRAEQDANDWWEAVCKASKKAVATAKIDPATIRGMSQAVRRDAPHAEYDSPAVRRQGMARGYICKACGRRTGPAF